MYTASVASITAGPTPRSSARSHLGHAMRCEILHFLPPLSFIPRMTTRLMDESCDIKDFEISISTLLRQSEHQTSGVEGISNQPVGAAIETKDVIERE